MKQPDRFSDGLLMKDASSDGPRILKTPMITRPAAGTGQLSSICGKSVALLSMSIKGFGPMLATHDHVS
jgi:hypothetical protein